MNPNQELDTLIADIRESWPQVKNLPGQLETLSNDVRNLRRSALLPGPSHPRPQGRVSDRCAEALAYQFVLQCERKDLLGALADSPLTRDALLTRACDFYGLHKTALTTTDIPLPSEFSGEIRSLISEFGVARRVMSPFPIGRGTARPARFGTRPTFGAIAMSAAITEKSPTITYASLESHKVGGLVRLPRELDEQSMVNMGQFLARYGAIEFARAEDTFAFLADGTTGYESIKGVCQIATDLEKTVTLASGKTKPSDITAAALRELRTKVNKGALSGKRSAYYLDSTFDTFLPTLNTEADPFFYRRLSDGSAALDGYPVVWTDVLQPYTTDAAAGEYCAVFGALGFWWFGEHGHPRMDTNDSVFFANDQLAIRFIEEIDFDYMASDAVAVLLTAAS